ncbi:aquaporin Z [Candidatus Bathyarchaeota archaeon A05DMB-2]|jgi:aquaporin Z|nr:aquaporin Z [Candidatus Bathyarchaeota archaeon A05DMB-2]
MSENSAAKKYASELIGTLVLVMMGCGSAVIAARDFGIQPGGLVGIGTVGIAFAFGLSVLAMVYAIGGISGCHINPAISISMLAAGKISVKDTVGYIIAQCVGATIGAAFLYAIALGLPTYSLSLNGLGQNGFDAASPAGYSMMSAFIAEVLFTFLFLLVIHGSTSEKAPKGFAGIAIGLSLVLIHLVGIPIDGTSVNPARSLGPAVIMSMVNTTALSQLWLFWAAPIIGGLIAAAVWRFLQ